MGRYSDTPPPFVVPVGDEWFPYARQYVYGTVGFAYCGDFRADPTVIVNDDDACRRVDLPACKNRDRMGDRRHNWCLRCPAGHISISLDEHDAGRDRDALQIA